MERLITHGKTQKGRKVDGEDQADVGGQLPSCVHGDSGWKRLGTEVRLPPGTMVMSPRTLVMSVLGGYERPYVGLWSYSSQDPCLYPWLLLLSRALLTPVGWALF